MEKKSVRILGIGDNVSDQYVQRRMMYPGGQALNVAAFARMQGAQAGFLGAFGNDAPADHIQRVLDSLEVDTSRCRHYEGENGASRVALENGDRIFLGSNKGGVLRLHPLELEERDLVYIRSYQIVHTSNNSYLDKELEKIRAEGVLLSYDFSLAWNDEARLEKVGRLADFVFLSCSQLTEEKVRNLLDRLCRLGCRLAIGTRGARGAMICDGNRVYVQPSCYVEPVDTMGAGDAFASAMLVNLRSTWDGARRVPEGEQIWQAAEAAARFSAQICRIPGAFGHGRPIPENYEMTMVQNP